MMGRVWVAGVGHAFGVEGMGAAGVQLGVSTVSSGTPCGVETMWTSSVQLEVAAGGVLVGFMGVWVVEVEREVVAAKV